MQTVPPKQKEITKPLKIAICTTKTGTDAMAVYMSLDRGLKLCGDEPKICGNIEDVKRFCPDVLFMVSYPYFDPESNRLNHGWREWQTIPKKWNSPMNQFRIDVLDWCKQNNRRVLIIDSPAMKGNRDRRGNANTYYAVTYDHEKGLGEYYPPGLAYPDRWKKFDLDIKPWTEAKTDNFLIIGQLQGGIGSQIDINRFYKYVLLYLKDRRKTATFLRHPNEEQDYVNHKFKIKYVRDREKPFEGIQCAIGFSSNMIIDALRNGIPCIVLSPLSQAYHLCSNTLDDLENPKKFDREWFLHSLAWSQWQISEMATGEFWKNHLRKYSLFNYSGA